MSTVALAAERVRAARAGRALQYLTIGWNAAECVVALVAGTLAGSVALVGFGLDSAIEASSRSDGCVSDQTDLHGSSPRGRR